MGFHPSARFFFFFSSSFSSTPFDSLTLHVWGLLTVKMLRKTSLALTNISFSFCTMETENNADGKTGSGFRATLLIYLKRGLFTCSSALRRHFYPSLLSAFRSFYRTFFCHVSGWSEGQQAPLTCVQQCERSQRSHDCRFLSVSDMTFSWPIVSGSIYCFCIHTGMLFFF